MPLSASQVVTAYRVGVFPMAESREGRLFWLSPDPRAILPIEEFHVPRRLAQTVKAGKFRVTTDEAFERVIDGCARPDTWISPEVRAAYVELHRRGIAHSVEAWKGDQLAGGLYGVHLGGAFMAESKFHAARDASKVGLVALVAHLRRIGAVLCDVQFVTPHLARFGVREISRDEYLRRLSAALDLACRWGPPGPLPP
ncbi:MAG: leucyl/phenylalanyl-tRNA--protein transferase [Planctomycetes bacterium]|nr:leucyl/phenylalanyl-tRNA--protein transferase [Planctomycetota bacterium]